MSVKYGTLPSNVKENISPFVVDIPQPEIDGLHTALKSARIGALTYESNLEDQKYGISQKWLSETKKYWLENFDWQHHQNHINNFPQFKSSITDFDGKPYTIHFAALFSKNPKAIPLLFLHGWPGSFLEFLPILTLLKQKYPEDTLPYHVIVPSLPGYAFSSPPPTDRDFRIEDIARLFDHLMGDLGFGDAYVVQGGDVGSKVARVIGATYKGCKAVHINFCLMPEPSGVDPGALSEAEKTGLKRGDEFKRTGAAYALEHATRPSTLGFVLNSNPLALLAWIGEKFLTWPDDPLPLDTILADITLYWVTQTIPTSLYPYRQLFTPGNIGAHENPIWHINKPFGFSWFPKEIAPVPRSWAETTGDLVFFREHEKGGHFAALEVPEVLLGDVEDFIKDVWKDGGI